MADQQLDPSSSNTSGESFQNPTGSEPSSSSSQPAQKCTACDKPSTEDKPLKPCAKCQSVHYCSRDCQKADFKKHKKVCALKAQEYAKGADFKMETKSSAPKEVRIFSP
ncbi:hypothetical protein BJ875DRAFT_488239 [Amylocarpus encephaloides]|uniref:MYND-type domain-containing protein n=1 Tax=Amylocarpus encephaloides TaxID=45428 RepID=A0A9P7YAM2_9HELO|nr:hypothetical protein BJ875DRAFT_488239 [Amylocarpus encephaloides]